MSIVEKKQGLGNGGIKKKEEKGDTSIFGGKPYISKQVFERQIRNPKVYRATGLKEKERIELGEKLFGSCGSYIDSGEAKKVKKQLELGKYGKFKDLSREKKDRAAKLIKWILGK